MEFGVTKWAKKTIRVNQTNMVTPVLYITHIYVILYFFYITLLKWFHSKENCNSQWSKVENDKLLKLIKAFCRARRNILTTLYLYIFFKDIIYRTFMNVLKLCMITFSITHNLTLISLWSIRFKKCGNGCVVSNGENSNRYCGSRSVSFTKPKSTILEKNLTNSFSVAEFCLLYILFRIFILDRYFSLEVCLLYAGFHIISRNS